MQDRYVGDAGDFGKFGLLRKMSGAGLKIGVNWYRIHRPEKHGPGDGKHIGYLHKRAFQGCDDVLLETLRRIVESGNRSIAALEEAELIPQACYYPKILRPGSTRTFSRQAWHQNAQKALADSDLIFCDPDNGLLVKSVPVTSAKSDKYVTEWELLDYYRAGKSVVFYNHRSREKEHQYLLRFATLKNRIERANGQFSGLTFFRGSLRDYIFMIQPLHFAKVGGAIDRLLQSNWSRHFNVLGSPKFENKIIPPPVKQVK